MDEIKKVTQMSVEYSYSGLKRRWYLNWKWPFIHFYLEILDPVMLSVSPLPEDLEELTGTPIPVNMTIGKPDNVKEKD